MPLTRFLAPGTKRLLPRTPHPPSSPWRSWASCLHRSHVCKEQNPAPSMGEPHSCSIVKPDGRARGRGDRRGRQVPGPSRPGTGNARELRTLRPPQAAGRAACSLGATPAPGRSRRSLSRCPSGNNDPFTSRLLQSQQLWRRRTKGPFHHCWAGSTARLPGPRCPRPAQAGLRGRRRLPIRPSHGHPGVPPHLPYLSVWA